MFAVVSSLFAIPAVGEQTKTVPKLVWAHYVGWGFDFESLYDKPESTLTRLYDRPLLGDGWASTDTGVTSTTRLDVLAAMQYGIDGFTVDITSSRGYAGAMSRFYQAAEGMPFYISLCVDGWDAGPVETIVEHLSEYFHRWKTHPNNFYIDEKPVVFVYSVRGKTTDECRQILEQLKENGHEAYWLVQPSRENSGWSDAKRLREMAEVFDGFYDFGSNGVSRERMKQTLRNGRAALNAVGKHGNGVLVGGVTQGYNGGHNGFYRPYFGTGTIRDNWQAIFEEPCDWVCLTTWNDYWESTQFGPSDWAREALLKINREQVRLWRGEPVPKRPPSVVVSYKNEVRLGDDWTLEILGFPYTTEESICRVRLLDFDGKPMRTFEPVRIDKNSQTLVVHSFEQPGFDTPRALRVQAVVQPKESGFEPKDGDWKELYPLFIRPGVMRDYQTLRIALTEMLPQRSPPLKVETTPDGLVFRSNIESWSWVGKAELLCNGRPVASKQVVANNKGPRTGVEFSCPSPIALYPRDCYVIRYSRLDGRYGWSNPVLVRNRANTFDVRTSVFVRKGDFDENWSAKPDRTSPEIRPITVSSDEIYGFAFAMDDDPAVPRDIFGWSVAAQGGGRRGRPDEAAVPKAGKSNENDDPNAPRHYFSFDGQKSRILLQTTSMPHDGFCFEATIRPKKQTGQAYIFSDQNESLGAGVLQDGRIFVERKQTRLVSETPVDMEKWVKINASYDGKSLALQIDGRDAGSISCPPSILSINSVPAIGCRHRIHMKFDQPFCGDIADLRVSSQ